MQADVVSDPSISGRGCVYPNKPHVVCPSFYFCINTLIRRSSSYNSLSELLWAHFNSSPSILPQLLNI